MAESDQRVPAADLGVPVGGDDQQAGVSHPAGQVHEQRQRGGVGPLELVQDDDESCALRVFPQLVADGFEGFEASGRRVGGRAAFGQGRRQRVVESAGDLAEQPVRRAASSSLARPQATGVPVVSARDAASCASRVLPMPGSPAMRTSRPLPDRASLSRCASSSVSSARPTTSPLIPRTPGAAGRPLSRRSRTGGPRGLAEPTSGTQRERVSADTGDGDVLPARIDSVRTNSSRSLSMRDMSTGAIS